MVRLGAESPAGARAALQEDREIFPADVVKRWANSACWVMVPANTERCSQRVSHCLALRESLFLHPRP